MPYTYLIGWKEQDKWYIGARFANELPPEEDLWNEYPTSSGHVAEFRSRFGEPDHIEVLAEFATREEAGADEVRRQIEANVLQDDRYLNGAIIHTNGLIEYWGKHVPKSPAHVAKIAAANRGKKRPHTSESKASISEGLSKYYAENPAAKDQKRQIAEEKMSSSYRDEWLEKIHSEESRQKRSVKRKELALDPEFKAKHGQAIKDAWTPDRSKARSEIAKKNDARVKCSCGYESNRLTMSRHRKKCNA